MNRKAYYFVNGLTLYRLCAAPVLAYLIFTGNLQLFKWLLPVSFFTDLLDGYLARKLHVATALGAMLDSIADDINIVVAVTGAFIFKPEFIKEQMITLIIMFALFLLQMAYAFYRYKRLSSFHTYFAKLAALLQGVFLILLFLQGEAAHYLFYAAAIITILDLVEEIIIVYLLPEWETNVKGLYWILRRKKPI
jgi:phosphatidylglycerophosphate synthase